MKINTNDTAVVFTDPQNEVLDERGLGWPLLRESLRENNTIESMERIFKAPKAHGLAHTFTNFRSCFMLSPIGRLGFPQ